MKNYDERLEAGFNMIDPELADNDTNELDGFHEVDEEADPYELDDDRFIEHSEYMLKTLSKKLNIDPDPDNC